VDVYPEKDVITPGGEALNIAAQLSRREDLEVYLMAMIGRDAYARKILESIDRLEINTQHVYQVEGETANHVIKIDREGDRYFEQGAWNGGVSGNLAFSAEDRALISRVDGILVTLWEPNLRELVKLKKQQGGFLLAVDFNDRRDFRDWEDVIGDLDVFFSSAEESMKADFLARSRATSCIFVLTFGADGSVAYHEGREFACPAVPVDEVIDTTGCGDCYQGHFVAEYLKTRDIMASMQRAAHEAAQVTAYVGGFKP
jgi:fructoselysine 6-kinase